VSLLLQRLFDALSNGAVYASLAVALSMVFRSSGVLNLAQGEMAMFSCYVAALLRTSPHAEGRIGPPFPGADLFAHLGTPWPVWAAILAAVIVGVGLGAVVQRFVIQPLDQRDPLPAVGAIVGIYLLLRGLATTWWGGSVRRLGSPFPDRPEHRFDILGARLRYETIGIVTVLVLTLALLTVVQRRTKLGLAFRALVSNPEGARLVGIRVGSVLMIGWAIAAGLGALGGGLIANTLHVRPDMMARLLVFALAAAILGGLGNPVGAVVGGFAFALLETLLIGYVPFITADIALVYTLGLLILVLTVRPGGILGSNAIVDRSRA
jgi:branched-chain amino acid transport system permease protein